jgi:hypothetical protein
VIHLLVLPADTYLAHPLRGLGYQFYSGIGSSITEWATTIVTLVVLLAAFWRAHECHVTAPKSCHHWGHLVPGTGHRACREHHPHAESGKVSAEDILRHHEESDAS